MKNITVTFFLLLVLLITIPTPVHADNFENKSNVSLSKKIVKKFTRGVVNIITGPGEILKQPLIESDKADSLIGVPSGCMTGFFMGIGWMFYRVGTGIFDIITFPIPINSYETLIEPEFII